MNKSLRVASIVLNDFRNDNRVLKVCKTLLKEGHSVEVGCLHRPGLALSGNQHGVPFQRVKLLSYPLSYAFSPIKFLEFALKLRWRYHDRDVWIANDFEALMAYDVAKKLGLKAKLIYDSHEYQSHIESVKSNKRRKFIQNNERRILQKSTPVFNVSPGIVQAYRDLYELENQRLLMNLPEYRPQVTRGNKFRSKFGISSDTTIFLYQGKMTPHRGLEEIMEAFIQLEGANIALVLMGFGELVEEVKKLSTENPHIFYHPAVGINELINYTSSADWGISNLQNTCLNHYHSLPNKIFEYVQAGVPILASSMRDSTELIEKYGVGSIMKSNDINDIKRAILEATEKDAALLRKNLRKAGKELIWEKQEYKIREALESLNLT